MCGSQPVVPVGIECAALDAAVLYLEIRNLTMDGSVYGYHWEVLPTLLNVFVRPDLNVRAVRGARCADTRCLNECKRIRHKRSPTLVLGGHIDREAIDGCA